ncbi:M57 family metalloprotease [Fulvivirga ligni]|uniref:M57 family metalloprotease n=1 Tax=Fulvivirga ligni TaxID=2904246 RepID=UPI001F294A7B|nr:M57 family metalloprotease [Fulvivirga ligni]UII19131.1 M57 family metalloprotease [Fulvivirga ligni]
MKTKQLKFRLNLSVFAILAVMFSFYSCNQEEEMAPNNKPEVLSEELDDHVVFLTSTGFEKEEIAFNNERQMFVIGEDVMISKTEVENYIKRDGLTKNGKEQQRRGTYIVSNAYVTNVKYYMDGTVPSSWRTAINDAVAAWNAVNGTKLYMSVVSNSGSANIRVSALADNGAGWVARATLPGSNGAPGSIMEINTYYNSMGAGMKLFAMAHEMGHNIGLLHTNQTDGAIIPGTPTTDANSVMNSFVLEWNGFTYYDQVAVQVLYPEGNTGNVVTVYKDCNYSGAAQGYPVGSYTLSQMQARGTVNDDISSFRVSAGYRIIFYEHDNFQGAGAYATSDISCLLNYDWNDRISSIKVEAF